MTLGEVLIDLTQTGIDEKSIPQYKAFPGGAPANVAVAASRLGAAAGFTGKIGRDSFGAQLRKALEDDSVDTACLFETEDVPTTLAIVSVDEKGERSFSFYRTPGADTQLTAAEAVGFLDAADLPKILHFGSLSLTAEPSRQAALTAVKEARENGVLISYDPNYREALWPDEEEAVFWMKAPLKMVDILKISDEELVLLTGTDNLDEGSGILAGYGIRLIMITLGSEGVYYRFGDICGTVAAEKVTVCDTNGAGDTFLGAVLAKLVESGAADIVTDEETLREILAFANRAAAITCSRAGAIPAMPTREELGE
ncbi:MAG: carbohydrate kinase family protein [Bacillota bacterium]